MTTDSRRSNIAGRRSAATIMDVVLILCAYSQAAVSHVLMHVPGAKRVCISSGRCRTGSYLRPLVREKRVFWIFLVGLEFRGVERDSRIRQRTLQKSCLAFEQEAEVLFLHACLGLNGDLRRLRES